jgi:hypothetical protein
VKNKRNKTEVVCEIFTNSFVQNLIEMFQNLLELIRKMERKKHVPDSSGKSKTLGQEASAAVTANAKM